MRTDAAYGPAAAAGAGRRGEDEAGGGGHSGHGDGPGGHRRHGPGVQSHESPAAEGRLAGRLTAFRSPGPGSGIGGPATVTVTDSESEAWPVPARPAGGGRRGRRVALC